VAPVTAHDEFAKKVARDLERGPVESAAIEAEPAGIHSVRLMIQPFNEQYLE
jgi:hypothetical protein